MTKHRKDIEVGDHARCGCRDLCNVFGEVVNIWYDPDDRVQKYTIQWELPGVMMGQSDPYVTYDHVTQKDIVLTAKHWEGWKDICEIPL